MDDPEGERWLEPLPEEERRASWHLIYPDGRYLNGGEGAVALLELVRPVRPLGRLARRLRGQALFTAVDHVVKRHRSRLGKVVPKVPQTRRFP